MAASAPSRRILPIDATRGFAMCFVCLSHFSALLESARPELADTMANIAMIATPTFLLISGAMLGLLQSSDNHGGPELVRRLFHRGLLVAVVGHLLISYASTWAHHASYGRILIERIYVTDVVGLCLMVLPRFMPARSSRALLALGVSLYAVTLLGVYLWHPVSPAGTVAKQLLAGLEGDPAGSENRYLTPVLPYIAVYLLGIPLGRQLARTRSGPAEAQRFAQLLGRIGLTCFGSALVLKALWKLSALDPATPLGTLVHELTSPVRKIPPGPAYLLFFAGLGVLCLATFFRASVAGRGRPVLETFAVLGQASFFVYVFQAYVFGPLLGYVPAASSALWPGFFAGSLVVVWCAGFIWKSNRGNRLLDITYRLF